MLIGKDPYNAPVRKKQGTDQWTYSADFGVSRVYFTMLPTAYMEP